MVTEIEKAPNLKLVVDRAINLHLQLQNHNDLPLFQLLDGPMGIVKNAIESVYRSMVIIAFRQAIHDSFTDEIEINGEAYVLSIEDLREGAAILIECQTLVEEETIEEDFEIISIAQKFAALPPDSPTYIATEPALRQRFTEEIRPLIDNAAFDGTSVNSLRLSDIYNKLNLMADRSLQNLISLIDSYGFYEIEEAFRLQWLDLKFTELRADLHADEPEDINSKLNEYRIAIQNAFGVTFDKETTASDWVLATIHFIRLGLSATADILASKVQLIVNASDNPTRIVNRFNVFRQVMGGCCLRM